MRTLQELTDFVERVARLHRTCDFVVDDPKDTEVCAVSEYDPDDPDLDSDTLDALISEARTMTGEIPDDVVAEDYVTWCDACQGHFMLPHECPES